MGLHVGIMQPTRTENPSYDSESCEALVVRNQSRHEEWASPLI